VKVRYTLVGRCAKCGGIQTAIVLRELNEPALPYRIGDDGPNPCITCHLREEVAMTADERVEQVRTVFNDRQITVTYTPDSPWISIDVGPLWGAEATDENDGRKFAIWITTGAIYRVASLDGATEDDPVPEGANLRDLELI
jgi:hypothetical protein